MAAGAVLDEILALDRTKIQATQIADLTTAMESVQREMRAAHAALTEIRGRLDTLAAALVLGAEIAAIHDGMRDDGMPGGGA